MSTTTEPAGDCWRYTLDRDDVAPSLVILSWHGQDSTTTIAVPRDVLTDLLASLPA